MTVDEIAARLEAGTDGGRVEVTRVVAIGGLATIAVEVEYVRERRGGGGQPRLLAAGNDGEVGQVALPHALHYLVDGLVGVGPLHLTCVDSSHADVVAFSTINLHHI